MTWLQAFWSVGVPASIAVIALLIYRLAVNADKAERHAEAMLKASSRDRAVRKATRSVGAKPRRVARQS